MTSLTIKLVTVGNVGVGKTCVITRFHSGEYQEEYLVTIGAHFYSKEMTIDGETVKA
jgi:GTPase SAR1 family protein